MGKVRKTFPLQSRILCYLWEKRPEIVGGWQHGGRRPEQ
jgi:hypothetical protein